MRAITCFVAAGATPSIPVYPLTASSLPSWLEAQPPAISGFVKAAGFRAESGRVLALPDGPDYRLEGLAESELAGAALGWALGAYQFTAYKEAKRAPARLVLPKGMPGRDLTAGLEAAYLVRDLVNTPASDLGPDEIEQAARDVAARHEAVFKVTRGADLLAAGLRLIHAVGQASPRAPRLIDIGWGPPAAPKLVLVGKGVVFDTGGLDIKPASGMLLMKKDMGGAAHVLGLAHMIMAAETKVRLRVLIPVAENAISGNAFRPGDILKSHKGLTVEIGNTDAEGRLILADALSLADAEAPELIIDMATLTGAARSALGPDLPALFTEDDGLASALLAAGETEADPLWRLPLWTPYAKWLESPVADINNSGSSSFAGAITAALFLKRFVEKAQAYAHLDIYAWTSNNSAARSVGGEAQALRAIFRMLKERYA